MKTSGLRFTLYHDQAFAGNPVAIDLDGRAIKAPEAVRRMLLAHGLSVEQFAVMLGVDSQTVRRYMQDGYDVPANVMNALGMIEAGSIVQPPPIRQNRRTRKIMKLRREGLSCYQIADELKVSRQMVGRVVRYAQAVESFESRKA